MSDKTRAQTPTIGQTTEPRKPVRKMSPFLSALRRVEIIISDLPIDLAVKVAEHAMFVAKSRPELHKDTSNV